MHVELVRTHTRDGLRLDGALSSPLNGPTTDSRLPAAILLHGVAANFYTSSTFEPLIPKLQSLGIAALTVNTRGHDSVFGTSVGTVRRRLGAAYEIVDDCRQDVAAWIDFLRRSGCARIMLIGHSLGGVKAVYSQAHEQWPEIAGVIAISAPRLSYSAFMNAPDSHLFFESYHTADRMVRDGRGDELFTSKFPFPMLITAAGYVDKYGPAERYNLLKYAADLPCPALFIYGSKELSQGGVPFAGLPDALTSLADPSRRSVAVVEGADHVYTGVGEQLVSVVADWLQNTI